MGRDPLIGQDDDGATQLSAEEREGLRLSQVTLRRELNEAEQRGIDDADRWAFSRRRNVVDERFLLGLHRRMFGAVWNWAGERRGSGKNIGIEPQDIEVELRILVGDVAYWIENKTFSTDEIALRFHHRLTQIHPFPNGNGRFARLAADLLIVQLGGERFSWGRGDLLDMSDLRRRYVESLRLADREMTFAPLLAFARS